MRSAMSVMKDEHVKSLKKDFEKVCKDKVELQVQLSEMKDKVSENEKKIDELVRISDELERKTKKNEEDDVLDLLDFTA